MMRIILPKRSTKCQDHTAKLWIEDPRSSTASLEPISQMRIQRAPIGDKRGQTKGSSETPAGPSAIPASRRPRGPRRYHVPERTEDLEDCRAGPGAFMDREPGLGRDSAMARRDRRLDAAVGEGPGLARRRTGLHRGAGRPAGAREVFVVDRSQRPAGAGERCAAGLLGWHRPGRQPLGNRTRVSLEMTGFVGAAL